MDVDDFNAGGCRKLQRENTGVPMYMGVGRFTCVCVAPLRLPLLDCADGCF